MDQVAIPGRGACIGVRVGVVPGVAGVDGIHAVIGEGGAEARLDHLTERHVESGDVVSLRQTLAVEGVIAGQDARVERPVVHVDHVIELDVLGVELRMDYRNEAAGLLRQNGLIEGRFHRAAGRGGAIGEPTGDANAAQAVGGAEEVFRCVVALVADVQVVRHLAAERVVVADLPALPVKAVVVVRNRVESHQSAAGELTWSAAQKARIRRANITVLRDDRRDEGVISSSSTAGGNRHGQESEMVEVVDVELASNRDRGRRGDAVIGEADSGIPEVGELERPEALAVRNP